MKRFYLLYTLSTILFPVQSLVAQNLEDVGKANLATGFVDRIVFHIKDEVTSVTLGRGILYIHSKENTCIGFLYTPRLSSTYYKGFKTSRSYQPDTYRQNVAYEPIYPRNRKAVSCYSNDDLENTSVAITG